MTNDTKNNSSKLRRPNGSGVERISGYVPTELAAEMRSVCTRERRSVSHFLEVAVRQLLDRKARAKVKNKTKASRSR